MGSFPGRGRAGCGCTGSSAHGPPPGGRCRSGGSSRRGRRRRVREGRSGATATYSTSRPAASRIARAAARSRVASARGSARARARSSADRPDVARREREAVRRRARSGRLTSSSSRCEVARSSGGAPRPAARPSGRRRRASGRTIVKSLRQTVATPRKWPGRCSSSSIAPRSATSTHVWYPGGYISSAEGAKTTSTPAAPRSPGVARLVSGVPVQVGGLAELGGIDEEAHHDRVARSRAAARRARWPPCSAPIVGTSPMRPSRRAVSAERTSCTVRATIT